MRVGHILNKLNVTLSSDANDQYNMSTVNSTQQQTSHQQQQNHLITSSTNHSETLGDRGGYNSTNPVHSALQPLSPTRPSSSHAGSNHRGDSKRPPPPYLSSQRTTNQRAAKAGRNEILRYTQTKHEPTRHGATLATPPTRHIGQDEMAAEGAAVRLLASSDPASTKVFAMTK
jgi:hypothetical protein